MTPIPAAGTGSSQDEALFDVVVVSYNQRERLLACLGSVRMTEPAARLIVVDNDSKDGSTDAVRKQHPEVDVLEMGDNLGFAVGVNCGASLGKAPFILLLNNDARLRAGALDKLRATVDAESVGAAGPRLLDTSGATELSLGRTLSPWNEAWFKLLGMLYRSGRGPLGGAVARYYGKSRPTRSLSGACVLLARDAYERVGGLDEQFFLYAEDVDLCRRLRQAGYELRYVHDAVVEHDHGASSAVEPTATARHYRRSQLAFYRKHHGVVATGALRLYLALRFALRWLFARGEAKVRAAALLRDTVRGPGR